MWVRNHWLRYLAELIFNDARTQEKQANLIPNPKNLGFQALECKNFNVGKFVSLESTKVIVKNNF